MSIDLQGHHTAAAGRTGRLSAFRALLSCLENEKGGAHVRQAAEPAIDRGQDPRRLHPSQIVYGATQAIGSRPACRANCLRSRYLGREVDGALELTEAIEIRASTRYPYEWTWSAAHSAASIAKPPMAPYGISLPPASTSLSQLAREAFCMMLLNEMLRLRPERLS